MFVISLLLIRFMVLGYDFCYIYVIFSVIIILEIFNNFGDLRIGICRYSYNIVCERVVLVLTVLKVWKRGIRK